MISFLKLPNKLGEINCWIQTQFSSITKKVETNREKKHNNAISKQCLFADRFDNMRYNEDVHLSVYTIYWLLSEQFTLSIAYKYNWFYVLFFLISFSFNVKCYRRGFLFVNTIFCFLLNLAAFCQQCYIKKLQNDSNQGYLWLISYAHRAFLMRSFFLMCFHYKSWWIVLFFSILFVFIDACGF